MADTLREPGFYWVHELGVGWIVCRWAPLRGWDRPRSAEAWNDDDFSQIGPKIEPPFTHRIFEYGSGRLT